MTWLVAQALPSGGILNCGFSAREESSILPCSAGMPQPLDRDDGKLPNKAATGRFVASPFLTTQQAMTARVAVRRRARYNWVAQGFTKRVAPDF